MASIPTDMRPSPWMRCVLFLSPVLRPRPSTSSAPSQNGSLAPGHASRGRNSAAYRAMFPFFLIVAAVLLLVIRLVSSSSSAPAIDCPENTQVYHISRGNTCWNFAQAWGISVDDILHVNDGLNCDSLRPGEPICLPQRKT